MEFSTTEGLKVEPTALRAAQLLSWSWKRIEHILPSLWRFLLAEEILSKMQGVGGVFLKFPFSS